MKARAGAPWGCWLLAMLYACAQGTEADIDPARMDGAGKGGGTGSGGASAGTNAGGKSSQGGASGGPASTAGSGGTSMASGGTSGDGEAGAFGSPGGSGALAGAGGASDPSVGGDSSVGGDPGVGGEPGVGGDTGSAGAGNCAVASPYKVQVYNCKTGVNTPGCSMRVVKSSSGSVALSELKVSYWISKEETAPWSYINTTVGRHYPAEPYYDTDLSVMFDEVDDPTGTAGADTRFDFTFSGTKGLGSIGANEDFDWGWYMSINNGGAIGTPDDDYSQRAAADPGANGAGFDKVTLYVGGTLVWGCEP